MAMAKCECCGNEYEGAFSVVMRGEEHHFDSFECAIHMLAPKCVNCGMRVIGHGVEEGERVFCCAHCARVAGVGKLKDHVDEAVA